MNRTGVLDGWVFHTSRCIGLWPLDEHGTFKKHLTLKAWFSLAFACTMFFVCQFGIFSWLVSKNAGQTYVISYLMEAATQAVLLASVITHTRIFGRYESSLATIYMTLSSVKKSQFSQNFCLISYMVGLIIALLAFDIYYSYFSYIKSSTWCVPLSGALNVYFRISSSMIVLQFSFVVLGLGTLMEENISRMKCRQFELNQHMMLIKMSRTVNTLFQIQLLLVSLISFWNLLMDAYNMILLFMSERPLFEQLYTLGNCLYLFFDVYTPMTVAWYTELLRRKAEAFNTQLFRMMHESDELCSNKKLRLFVQMKPTIHFTACGFFSLGYPLVTSIIAAATTYLVILVQFSMTQ